MIYIPKERNFFPHCFLFLSHRTKNCCRKPSLLLECSVKLSCPLFGVPQASNSPIFIRSLDFVLFFHICSREKEILSVLRLSSRIGLAFFFEGGGSLHLSVSSSSCLIVPEIYAIFLPLYNNNSVYRTDMLEDDAHTGA